MLNREIRNGARVVAVVASCGVVGLYAIEPLAGPVQQEVKTIRPLLLEAIRRGTASGRLVNDGTVWAAKVLGSSAPVVIDVKRIADLRDPGCKRLEVTTSQQQVVQWSDKTGEKAPPQDMSFKYEIGFCEDGTMLGLYKVTK